MKNVTVLNCLTRVLSTKERKKDACCIYYFSCSIWFSPEMYISCISLFFFTFFLCTDTPTPGLLFLNMVPYLLYTVFSMYTLCKSRAFLQNYLILSFQFFQAEMKCYFLILGWLLEKKTFFSVYFAFLSHNMLLLTRCYFLFTTPPPPQKGHYFSLTG